VRLVEVVGYEADEARISHFYKWERFNKLSQVREVMKLKEIGDFISTIGFPVFVAVYVLVRLEKTICCLKEQLTINSKILARISGVNYEEIVKETKQFNLRKF
jgi:hypothetical protein